jgi:uncharacterized protein (TIGR00299 family) protein
MTHEMKIAYLDCFSGISGDMFLGALLDAGLEFEELKRALLTLPLDGYDLEMRREKRGNLLGTRFVVKVELDKQAHRNLRDIRAIIQAGRLSQEVKNRSIEIFETLAQVEGKIHDRPPEEVHFHEVGAVDSIIDIVGAVFGLERLGITSLAASSLPLGSGFVETEHGTIPLPAPATIALLKDIPVYDSRLRHELVTPTGAALVKSLAGSFGSMPSMRVDRVGYGVGSRNLPDRPNLLRIITGYARYDKQTETVVILEANLDDTNPEWMGFLMDRLFEAGALDVIFCPIQMKKNRPAILIQVIGKPEDRDDLMDILFMESTTIGIRFRYNQRKILQRSSDDIDSPWGKMKVKKIFRPDGSSFVLPEYEVCRRIAEENKIPIKEIYYWVMSANKK